MSHFTSIKTTITEQKHLLQALRSLGYQPEEGRVFVTGFAGAQTRVEIRVPTKNPAYDLGFRKKGGTFELVADWYGLSGIDRTTLLQQLNQSYAYHATREKLAEQGFSLASEQVQEDGAIHLVLRRVT